MSKKKQDIIVSFADSESVNDVTGSSVHVNYLDTNILIECGLSQSGSLLDCYKKNNSNFKFKVKELDYVFVNHLHIDHIGRIPLLYARGCTAKLIVPTGSKEIMYKLLENCAMILFGEAKYLTKRSKSNKGYFPVYEKEDVDLMMKYVVEYDMYNTHGLNDFTRFKYISSGHVENSCSLILEIKKNQVWKKIYYTSDLGNDKYKTYYCNNIDKIKNADLVISECTYSTKEQSCNYGKQREKDKERLKSVIEHYDKVLIPVFSYHRGQSIATLLYEMYKDGGLNKNIYMDSKLLNDISYIFKKKYPEYREVLQWDKINIIDKELRSSLQYSKKPMIVLASSGMMSGGPSISWLQRFVTNPRACVVFTGYCSEGTLGWKLKLKDQKTITINGESYRNNIQVAKLKSFSSHMQHGGLLKYLSSINTPKVVLHHGNKSGKLSFKKELEEEYEKKCKSTKVLIPCKTTRIIL